MSRKKSRNTNRSIREGIEQLESRQLMAVSLAAPPNSAMQNELSRQYDLKSDSSAMIDIGPTKKIEASTTLPFRFLPKEKFD